MHSVCPFLCVLNGGMRSCGHALCLASTLHGCLNGMPPRAEDPLPSNDLDHRVGGSPWGQVLTFHSPSSGWVSWGGELPWELRVCEGNTYLSS